MTSQLATLGAGGAGFVPTQIAGLQLWLKGGAGTFQDTGLTTAAVADGDPVGGWQDQSGQGNNATQGTAAAKGTLKLNVLNGKAVVRGDGVDDYLTHAALTLGTTHTLFLVTQWPTATQAGILLGADGGDYAPYTNGSSTLNYSVNNPNPQQTCNVAFAPANATWYVLGIRRNGLTVRFYKNGAQLGTDQTLSPASNDPYAPTTLFAGGNTNFQAIDLAEVLYYNSTLSDANVTNVLNYLNGRYAIY
jgi:hypothetical protein